MQCSQCGGPAIQCCGVAAAARPVRVQELLLCAVPHLILPLDAALRCVASRSLFAPPTALPLLLPYLCAASCAAHHAHFRTALAYLRAAHAINNKDIRPLRAASYLFDKIPAPLNVNLLEIVPFAYSTDPVHFPDNFEFPPHLFDCDICFSQYIDPVTTLCGHSFCRQCILKSLSSSHSCPVCRADVSPSHIYTTPTTSLLSRNSPPEQPHPSKLKIGLFILHTFVFPDTYSTFHIFEPRYISLFRTALLTDKLVGVSDGDLGTICRIVEYKIHDLTGEFYVKLIGCERFRVFEKKLETEGYYSATVEVLYDSVDWRVNDDKVWGDYIPDNDLWKYRNQVLTFLKKYISSDNEFTRISNEHPDYLSILPIADLTFKSARMLNLTYTEKKSLILELSPWNRWNILYKFVEKREKSRFYERWVFAVSVCGVGVWSLFGFIHFEYVAIVAATVGLIFLWKF